MVTIAELEQQLRRWIHPLRLRLIRGEVKQLPNLLWEEEKIESAAQGWYQGGIVLLVATNRRLLLVDHKWLDTKVDDYPYARISSIEQDSNMWIGKIVISLPGTDMVVHRINSENLRDFCQVVMGHITQDHGAAPQTPIQLGNLQILALMLDRGLLTDEEFRAQWQQLIGSGGEAAFLDYKFPTETPIR